MSETTKIAWTEKTWNPWQGCHRVSAGCAHCYMMAEKRRYGQDGSTVVRSKPPTFNAPRKWKAPALVFTCSWSDFFIEEADDWRAEAWEIIRSTPHLTYQILTKRPERILKCLPADWGSGWRNVWIGTTVEDQPAADLRIPPLLAVPAAVLFLSCEPLISPVDLNPDLYAPDDGPYPDRWVDWVIVGGESGPGARPCDVAWIRSLVKQCRASAVPVFVKQLGSAASDPPNGLAGHGLRVPEEAAALISRRLRDRKGGDPAEWPEDLRVREFPEARREGGER